MLPWSLELTQWQQWPGWYRKVASTCKATNNDLVGKLHLGQGPLTSLRCTEEATQGITSAFSNCYNMQMQENWKVHLLACVYHVLEHDCTKCACIFFGPSVITPGLWNEAHLCPDGTDQYATRSWYLLHLQRRQCTVHVQTEGSTRLQMQDICNGTGRLRSRFKEHKPAGKYHGVFT